MSVRSTEAEHGDAGRLVIGVPDDADFRSLHTWLSRSPVLPVERVPAPVRPGDQGAGWEFLSVLLGSGGVGVAALKVIENWFAARRPAVHVSVKVADKEWSVDATNYPDVLPLIEKTVRAVEKAAGDATRTR
jgi:hypothetical protein